MMFQFTRRNQFKIEEILLAEIQKENDFQIINPLTYNNWEETIFANPDSSIFHTKEWCQTLITSYGFEPNYLIIQDNQGKNIFPFMRINSIRNRYKFSSLPFSDYCDPLLQDRFDVNKLKKILFLITQTLRLSSINIHTCKNLTNNHGNYYFDCVQKVILSNPNQMYKLFSHGTKGNIKKAEKCGVNVKINNSLDGLNEFYRLQVMTRKRHNLPPQPIKFFQNLFNLSHKKNMIDIFIAYFNNIAIGSGIFLKFREKVFFKYANSDFYYQNLRPNNLIVWEAIKYYYDTGFRELDFGKTEYGNEGLKKYKSGFGCFELPLWNFSYDPLNNSIYNDKSRELSIKKIIFNRFVPVSHLRIVGDLIYKYFAS